MHGHSHDFRIKETKRVTVVGALVNLLLAAYLPTDDARLAEHFETAIDTFHDVGDRVFPHFISTHLPPGLTGLLIAAIFAAAMSTVSTSLNSSATLIMNDFYNIHRVLYFF